MKQRKIWDEETKKKVVAEKLNRVSVAVIQEKYGIPSPSQIYDWVRQAKGTKKKNKPKATKVKVKAKKAPNKMASAIILLNHARDIEGSDPESLRIVYGLAMMALRTLEGRVDG